MNFIGIKKSIIILTLLIVSFSNISLASMRPIENDDYKVLGIPSNASKIDIINSLGRPTREGNQKGLEASYYISYGGVKFSLFNNKDDSAIVYISINNKDAITARGIAVGDSIDKVFSLYGYNYQYTENGDNTITYKYISGRYGTDDCHGIEFYCFNGKVNSICIYP